MQKSAYERDGHRSALAFGLAWYIDIIAMVMGKVEQGPAMAGVENSLKRMMTKSEKKKKKRGGGKEKKEKRKGKRT